MKEEMKELVALVKELAALHRQLTQECIKLEARITELEKREAKQCGLKL